MKIVTTCIPRFVQAALLALILATQIPVDALAQERNHIVSIEDGKVFIDGREVPQSELPASLKIKNRTLNWEFHGDALLELNGVVYQLVDGTLVEADEGVVRDGNMVAFLRDPDNGESVVRILTRSEPHLFSVGENEKYGVVLRDYTEALNKKAEEFAVIREKISVQDAEQNYALAGQLQLQAEHAARMAKAFPRVEFESYLSGIHKENLGLYDELVREQDIESRTHRLAMKARTTADKTERTQIVEELRAQLHEAFELKQQNREQEIEQLAGRLDELRQKLNQRVELRDQIIESRLRELLGELDW